MTNTNGGTYARKTIELKPTEFIGHYQKHIPTANGLHLIKAGTGCGKTTFMTSVYVSNRDSVIVFPTKAIAEQVKIEIRERDAQNPNDALGLSRVVQLEHLPTHNIEIGVPVLFDEVQLFKEHGGYRSIFGNVAERINKLALTNPVYIVTGTWTDHLEQVFPLTTVTDFVKKFDRKVGFIELTALTANGEMNKGDLAIYTRSLADIVINVAIEFADLPTMFYLESREKLRVISDILNEAGLSNIVVTSCKEQPDAVKAWFKSGNIRDTGVDVILCTSVVAEGINVRDGANIVCMPDAPERLVQRFGRNRIDPITGECAGRYFLIGSPEMCPLPTTFSFENPDVGSLKQVTDGFSGIENDEHRSVANEFKHYQDMCRNSRFAQYIWYSVLKDFGYQPDFDLVMSHVRDCKDKASKSVRMKTAVMNGLQFAVSALSASDDIRELVTAGMKDNIQDLDAMIKSDSVNEFYRSAFTETTNSGKSFKLEFISKLMESSELLFETALKKVNEIENMLEVFSNSKLKAKPLEFMTKLDGEAREWCVLYSKANHDATFKRDHEINNMGLLADLALCEIQDLLNGTGGKLVLSRSELAELAHGVFHVALNGNLPDKWKISKSVVSDVKDQIDFERTHDSMVNLFALLIGAERFKSNGDVFWKYEPETKWWCEIPDELKTSHYNFNKALKKSGREIDLKLICEALKRTPVDLLSNVTPAKIFKLYDAECQQPADEVRPAKVALMRTVQVQRDNVEVVWGV